MKKILYLFLILGCVSCTDPIQIQLDSGSPLIVIDGFINNMRKDQVIRVLHNSDYFSTSPSSPITNAVVTVKDITANKNYTFTYSGNGNYVYKLDTNNLINSVNHIYQLNIALNGYTYTAQTEQKRTAIMSKKAVKISYPFIDTSLFKLGLYDTLMNRNSKPFYTVFLYAVDIADNNPDYYWVKTFRNDTLFNNPNDINTSVDGSGGPVYNSPQPVNYFTPPASFLGFKRYQLGNTCKVEIHSLSYTCYNFLNQAQAQMTNQGLFATTPENVKTNIVSPNGATKAVGWFNVAMTVSDSIIIK
ncbi:MAG: DUF4249 domain-containing protein [Bacteroidetes bacterium]|nr:DUF4249 domain-containing protein [Bacteroidota bacterium]